MLLFFLVLSSISEEMMKVFWCLLCCVLREGLSLSADGGGVERMGALQQLQSMAKNSKPAIDPPRPLTPEERQREWAAKIIEQAEEMRKDRKPLQQPVRRIAPAPKPEARTLREKQKAKKEPDAKEVQRELGRRVRLIPERAPRRQVVAPDLREALLTVFDGSLGPLRLSLRTEAEAMLSVAATFEASPADEEGVICFTADNAELLLDTRKCFSIAFDNDEDYAITVKRHDNLPFLSAILGTDDKPQDKAIERWHFFRNLYGG